MEIMAVAVLQHRLLYLYSYSSRSSVCLPKNAVLEFDVTGSSAPHCSYDEEYYTLDGMNKCVLECLVYFRRQNRGKCYGYCSLSRK